MRTRRGFFAVFSVPLLLRPLATMARADARTPRIGVLSPYSASVAPPSFDAFETAFRELGYVSGRNVTMENRWADGNFDRLPALAADLVRLHVDVLFSTWGTPTALAAKNATSTIPIVFAGVGDAVGVGLVASLARPGGNLTGSTFISEDTIGKQLEILKTIVPGAARVGVLINPNNPVYGPVLKASQEPAHRLGIELLVIGATRLDEIGPMLAQANSKHLNGLVVMRDSVFQMDRARVVTAVATAKLPAIYGSRGFAEAGGLLCYGPRLDEMYRRAAFLVDKVLKGAKPAEIPVEQATRFELVVNRKTARAQGLTIPPDLLVLADKVIE